MYFLYEMRRKITLIVFIIFLIIIIYFGPRIIINANQKLKDSINAYESVIALCGFIFIIYQLFSVKKTASKAMEKLLERIGISDIEKIINLIRRFKEFLRDNKFNESIMLLEQIKDYMTKLPHMDQLKKNINKDDFEIFFSDINKAIELLEKELFEKNEKPKIKVNNVNSKFEKIIDYLSNLKNHLILNKGEIK